MTPDSVLAKSPKGHLEIETRAHRLGGRLRQVLIRVDGVKTLDEFLAEAGELAETQLGQLEELLREGFLVETNPVVEAVPAIEPAAAEAPPAPVGRTPGLEFSSPVKFKLQDLLVDAIGADTGRMGAALRNCRNREELARWVETCLPFIQQMAGKAKATTFRKAARMLVGS